MRDAFGRIGRFLGRDDGPTAVEYAAMLALVISALFLVVGELGGTTAIWWQRNADRIQSATGP